jgi:MFS family permease
MRRWSVGAIVVGGGLVAATGTAVFGHGASMGALVVASLVFGFGMGLATTTIYAAAGHAVPEISRGIAIGYLTTAYLVGLAVSPVIAGFVGAWSMRLVFVVDTLGLVALVVYVAYRLRGTPAAGTAAAHAASA